MMASVFAMQPVGQIAGNLVALVVVAACKSRGTDNLTRTVDIMWRWVIGLGVIPGALALGFRFAIPETPRFLLDIEDDPIKAEFDATPLFGEFPGDGSSSMSPASTALEMGGSAHEFRNDGRTPSMEEIILPAPAMHNDDGFSSAAEPQTASSAGWTVNNNAPPVTLNSPWKLSKKDIRQYFWVEGNWRTLFATAMTWVSHFPYPSSGPLLSLSNLCCSFHGITKLTSPPKATPRLRLLRHRPLLPPIPRQNLRHA